MSVRFISLVAAVAACTLTTQVGGEVSPVPSPKDPRIRTVAYDPQEVIRLSVATGYQATIRFGGEAIESVALGDTDAWQATPNRSADLLFVRPLRGSETNLTVMTDSRLYSFRLVQEDAWSSVYVLEFEYPSPSSAPRPVDPPATSLNHWKTSGARAIRPGRISNDAQHVYVEWLPAQEQPAVFTVEANGSERLINGTPGAGLLVIHGAPDELVFRAGKLKAKARRTKGRVR